MQEKILITGAAGYIGSVLVPELLARGYRVIALDNLMYNQTPLLDCCHDKNLEIIRGDARDRRLMAKLLNGVEISHVIPLACIVGAPACDRRPEEARSTNLDAIKMLLEFRQKVIFPNTNSGYGVGQEGSLCDETSPINPISTYGKMKVEAEKALLAVASTITLRLATVFGISPRMRLDLLVNDFTYRAVNDGFLILFQAHFKRNYIHVRDVVRAFIHCIENFETMKRNAYNVGLSDANLSKWELCEEIKKQIPKFYFSEAEIGEDPDKRDYIISNEKIESTGFKPAVSLQDGIAELVKGYQVIKRNQFSNL